MRVMLINPCIPVYLRVPSLPLGLISIASYLRAHGDEVLFIDRMVESTNLRKAVERFRPQVIGISCISYQSSLDAKKVTAQLRKITAAPIIWGGQAASSLPELYLKEGKADYLSLGEGEISIYEFVRAVESGSDISQVAGLAFLDDNGKLCLTPERPVADLATFPEMDWSFVNAKKYFSSFFHCAKMFYLHASKGCPGACTFCSNRQFHQGRNRCRDPIHVMHDLEYLVGECGADGIYFSDEQFVPNRKVRNELLGMITQSDLQFVWGCQMRLGVLKPEDIDFMYKAGCRWILFGIESGSQETISAIKKGTDLRLAKPTIEYCEKLGITVQASFIIGFPRETPALMQKTIDMAYNLGASLPVLNILMPMPNSEIYFEQVKHNPNFHPPKTLKQLAKLEAVTPDSAHYNLSKIPSRDLYVVHYDCQWKDFIGKESVKGDSFGIVKKLALDTLDRIFKHGFKGFLYGTYYSVRQFLTVFFYAHCFPAVSKKYGLK